MSNDESQGSPAAPFGLPSATWERYITPPGYVYFFCPELSCIAEAIGRQDVEGVLQKIQNLRRDYNAPLGTEIFITLNRDATATYNILFINHNTLLAGGLRVLDEPEVNLKTNNNPIDFFHMRSEYWKTMSSYPCHKDLPHGAEEEAQVELNGILAMHVFQRDAHLPISSEEATKILEILKNCAESTMSTNAKSIKSWVVAKVLYKVYLYRAQSQYGGSAKPTFQRKIRHDAVFVRFLCLGMAESHIGRIRLLASSGKAVPWKTFVNGLLADWNNSNIIAGLILSSSIAFMAIPGRGASTRMVSTAGAFLSLASLVMGVFLTWKHQPLLGEDTILKDVYFNGIDSIGIEKMAAILSLPHVMLIWSLISFFGAILTYSFLGVDEPASEDSMHLSIGSRWVVLGLSLAILAVVLLAGYYLWKYVMGRILARFDVFQKLLIQGEEGEQEFIDRRE